MNLTADELEAWIGRHAVDAAGDKVGKIADVYMDDSTGCPEWLAVTTGLFGTRISFVPLAGAAPRGNDIVVAHDKSLVKDSPNVEADGQLSLEEEQRLYEHYGLTYLAPARSAASADSGDAELQEAGSASISSEVSADTARLRLRRSEAEALEDIEFDGKDIGDELGVEGPPK